MSGWAAWTGSPRGSWAPPVRMVFTPFHTEGAEAQGVKGTRAAPPLPPREALCQLQEPPGARTEGLSTLLPVHGGAHPVTTRMSPPQGCGQSAGHTLGWGLASPCRLERAGPCTPPSSLELARLAAGGPQQLTINVLLTRTQDASRNWGVASGDGAWIPQGALPTPQAIASDDRAHATPLRVAH